MEIDDRAKSDVDDGWEERNPWSNARWSRPGQASAHKSEEAPTEKVAARVRKYVQGLTIRVVVMQLEGVGAIAVQRAEGVVGYIVFGGSRRA